MVSGLNPDENFYLCLHSTPQRLWVSIKAEQNPYFPQWHSGNMIPTPLPIERLSYS